MVRSPLGWALRNSWRRGVLGGSGPWLVVGAGALVVKLVSRGRTPKVVYSEQLEPGQAIVVSHLAGDGALDGA